MVPCVSYCLEIWVNAYNLHTRPLFILQKRAMRIITKSNSKESTNDLFIKLRALYFSVYLVDCKIVQIMYGVYNNFFPKQNFQHVKMYV